MTEVNRKEIKRLVAEIYEASKKRTIEMQKINNILDDQWINWLEEDDPEYHPGELGDFDDF